MLCSELNHQSSTQSFSNIRLHGIGVVGRTVGVRTVETRRLPTQSVVPGRSVRCRGRGGGQLKVLFATHGENSLASVTTSSSLLQRSSVSLRRSSFGNPKSQTSSVRAGYPSVRAGCRHDNSRKGTGVPRS
jgi:hypothetical protein